MIGKYWKAIIALVGAVAAGLVTVQTDPDVVAVLPGDATGWLGAVAIPAVVGVLAYLKRNQLTADQVDKAIEQGDISYKELRELLNKFQP
ncbi:holin [Mycobacterium phage JacoRen57]|nr:holin [Mycobacterium phage JacoRen57]